MTTDRRDGGPSPWEVCFNKFDKYFPYVIIVVGGLAAGTMFLLGLLVLAGYKV